MLSYVVSRGGARFNSAKSTITPAAYVSNSSSSLATTEARCDALDTIQHTDEVEKKIRSALLFCEFDMRWEDAELFG
jgi:hypothetical protein